MAQALYQYSGSQRPKTKIGPNLSLVVGNAWSKAQQRRLDSLKPKPKAAPSAPSAPSASPASPSAAAGPKAAPDPRDASYWAQRSKLLGDHTRDLASLEQAQTYEDTDFAEAVRRRATQRGTDQQQIREGANREGLMFSGQLGKRQGDYDVAYTQQNADAQQQYERAKADRAPTIAALRQALASGMPLDEAALYAEAVDRQIERDAANPPNPYEGIDFEALARLMGKASPAPAPGVTPAQAAKKWTPAEIQRATARSWDAAAKRRRRSA